MEATIDRHTARQRRAGRHLRVWTLTAAFVGVVALMLWQADLVPAQTPSPDGSRSAIQAALSADMAVVFISKGGGSGAPPGCPFTLSIAENPGVVGKSGEDSTANESVHFDAAASCQGVGAEEDVIDTTFRNWWGTKDEGTWSTNWVTPPGTAYSPPYTDMLGPYENMWTATVVSCAFFSSTPCSVQPGNVKDSVYTAGT
jgi:hypothetical protein